MKKNIIIVGTILIICGIVLQITFYSQFKSKEKKKNTNDMSINLVDKKEISFCNENKKECGMIDNEFAMIRVNSEIPEVRDFVKKINTDTKKYQNAVSKSNTKDASCSKIKDKYEHSISVITNYNLYQDAEIISLAVNRIKKNLCTEEINTLPYEILIYDKKLKKKIEQSEILKRENITDESVFRRVQQEVDNINSIEDDKISMNDIYIDGKIKYFFYYNNSGERTVAYQQKKNKFFIYNELII